jgi:hypothetical protein
MTARGGIAALRAGMAEAIIGQAAVIERRLIGLLANANLFVGRAPARPRKDPRY